MMMMIITRVNPWWTTGTYLGIVFVVSFLLALGIFFLVYCLKQKNKTSRIKAQSQLESVVDNEIDSAALLNNSNKIE
jgi:hypothetical protein